MIAYQEYNTKSPLNGLAAKWAAEHTSLLPVDPQNIAPPGEGAAPWQPAAPTASESAAAPGTARPA